MARPLRVRLLGQFELEDQDLRALGSRKARQFLQVVAVGRDQPVMADRIIDTLWGDQLPSHPEDQLSVLASRVRAVLGRDAIVRSDAGYRLDYEWLDVEALERLTSETRARLAAGSIAAAYSTATAAVDLVRGPFLTELPDAEWLDIERAALRRVVFGARRLLAEAALAVGDLATAIEVVEQQIAEDSFDEAAARIGMRAFVGAGQSGAALALYGSLRSRLSTELGIDPSPPTEELHTRIVRGEQIDDVATDDTSKVSEHEPLVGRREAQAELEHRLSEARAGRSSLVVVEGEPGIGKTALLDAFARRAGDHALVLRAVAGESERSLPLQPIVDALTAHVRSLPQVVALGLLGSDAGLLAPLFGYADRSIAPPLVAGTDVAVMYGALLTVAQRAAGSRAAVLFLDDAHRAAPITLDFLTFATRRWENLLVVVARRPGGAAVLPAAATIVLPPLDRAAVVAIAGDARADQLFLRSGGNPLFLLELVAADSDELPETIVAAVTRRCDEIGEAGTTIRAAAVLGRAVDLDLLAAVCGREPIDVLDDVEAGAEARLLVEGSEGFTFRHDVVRDALALGVGSARAALWHREAARALRRRRVADPLWIADHARRGGELELAADAYREAAVAAMERFDYDAALELANCGLALVETASGLLTRARVQIALERFDPAQRDASAAARFERSAEASELAAWAAYFRRDFDAAERFASEARELADDEQNSAALVVAGRIRHARGDLHGAETLLEDAVRDAPFERAVAARTWFGVLRAHQSRAREALELFAPLLLPDPPFAGTHELLHALMFAGHAYAISGDVDAALRCFARYEREVDVRSAPRYAGRGDNFRAWTLRQCGALSAADDANEAVLAHAGSAIGETELAARLDLADGALAAGDIDRAGAYLQIAASHSTIGMVYGWRQEFKLRLLRGRAELARDENAIDTFDLLAADATRLGVPRYAIPAQIFAAVARRRRSESVAPADIAGSVEQAGEVIAIEAWWLTALAADEFDQPVWRDLAERRVAALRAGAVSVADEFTRYAAAVIEDPRSRG